jgi:hypothetical protein
MKAKVVNDLIFKHVYLKSFAIIMSKLTRYNVLKSKLSNYLDMHSDSLAVYLNMPSTMNNIPKFYCIFSTCYTCCAHPCKHEVITPVGILIFKSPHYVENKKSH